jgi:ferredoxin-type protein NapF
MTNGSRRGVLTSLFGKKSAQKIQKELCVVRPPYHQEGYAFSEICVTCQDTPCVNACEENIIFLDAAHTPCLDFTKRGCTFCDACASACPSGVLDIAFKKEIPVKAEIDIMTCMAWHQSLCNSCLDACEPRAILFLGLFRPHVEMDVCNGCGMCIGICPSSAIGIKYEEKA